MCGQNDRDDVIQPYGNTNLVLRNVNSGPTFLFHIEQVVRGRKGASLCINYPSHVGVFSEVSL